MSEGESLTFELPVEILDQIAVQGIQRAAQGLAKNIATRRPTSSAGFEDLYYWHQALDAMNRVLEYYGADPVMPVPE